MSYAIITIYINIISVVPISQLEKDHSMTETRRLKNVIFFQTIFKFSALKKDSLKKNVRNFQNPK